MPDKLFKVLIDVCVVTAYGCLATWVVLKVKKAIIENRQLEAEGR